MTQVGNTYAQGLYALAKEEQLETQILEELNGLRRIFEEEPGYIALLASPNLSKEERTALLDETFRGKIQPYLLNFLKILTEKGYIFQFADCCRAYRSIYNDAQGILAVKAVSAVALTEEQKNRLREKLSAITGKQVILETKVDSRCLGGIRLDYDGKRVDGTVAGRLQSVANLLKNASI